MRRRARRRRGRRRSPRRRCCRSGSPSPRAARRRGARARPRKVDRREHLAAARPLAAAAAQLVFVGSFRHVTIAPIQYSRTTMTRRCAAARQASAHTSPCSRAASPSCARSRRAPGRAAPCTRARSPRASPPAPRAARRAGAAGRRAPPRAGAAARTRSRSARCSSAARRCAAAFEIVSSLIVSAASASARRSACTSCRTRLSSASTSAVRSRFLRRRCFHFLASSMTTTCRRTIDAALPVAQICGAAARGGGDDGDGRRRRRRRQRTDGGGGGGREHHANDDANLACGLANVASCVALVAALRSDERRHAQPRQRLHRAGRGVHEADQAQKAGAGPERAARPPLRGRRGERRRGQAGGRARDAQRLPGVQRLRDVGGDGARRAAERRRVFARRRRRRARARAAVDVGGGAGGDRRALRPRAARDVRPAERLLQGRRLPRRLRHRPRHRPLPAADRRRVCAALPRRRRRRRRRRRGGGAAAAAHVDVPRLGVLRREGGGRRRPLPPLARQVAAADRGRAPQADARGGGGCRPTASTTWR